MNSAMYSNRSISIVHEACIFVLIFLPYRPDNPLLWLNIAIVFLGEVTLLLGSPLFGRIPFQTATAMLVSAAAGAVLPGEMMIPLLVLSAAAVGMDANDLLSNRGESSNNRQHRVLGIIELAVFNILLIASLAFF